MEWLKTLVAILIGVTVRFAIPLAVTSVLIYLLRQLDAHWQAEAEQQATAPAIEKPRCWEIRNCPPEQRESCPAFTQAQPCWQVFRRPNGYLKEACLNCVVFRSAPALTSV